MKQLPQGQYDFKGTEEKILKFWQSKPFFKPEYDPKTGKEQSLEEMKNDIREMWTLICPPPNAYDRPHIGNLSGYSYQDALARYNRIQGKKVLMVPGKDHAGLEGEATFVRDTLEKQGKKKSDFTREEFYKLVWESQNKFIEYIRKDEQTIGLSADFDRELYTLDPKIVNTVLGTFVDMYKDGLLYKGVRIINWDVKAQSTIPDNQCERAEREGVLYYIKYPIKSSNVKGQTSNEELGFLTVATTRPETMLGDTALVVNPTDERYKDFVGKKVLLPLTDREIPVITNGRIEKEFGTGVLKCTPAHAAEDYEIMLEWNNSQPATDNVQRTTELEQFSAAFEDKRIGYINVIDKNLRMVGPIPEKYKGMKVNAAREEVVKDLREAGFLEKEEKITQNVLVSERTGVIVEPLMASQWFMDVSTLKQPLMDLVLEGKVKIHPKNMERRFFAWVENMRDWAISRNLWWGYRLPVWYNGAIVEEIDENGQVQLKLKIKNEKLKTDELIDFDPANPEHMRVQLESPGESWIQDDDILDTWFSSGQWPYAVLEANDVLDIAFPTDVLVSGGDLLVKWDLTMMLFSYYKTGKQPFNDLYLTGLVKGTDGQKMSKSKKNFIPLDDTKEQYGVDSFRMNCFYQNKAGQSYAITSETLKNFRNFNNKIWNASKFVMMNLEGFDEIKEFSSIFTCQSADVFEKTVLNTPDWKFNSDDVLMISKMKMLESKYQEYFQKFRFGLITEELYNSFWHEFCDIYIEQVKPRVWKKSEDGSPVVWSEEEQQSRFAAQAVLYYSLKSYLRMLHPFIPFVTEEIWQHLVEDGKYEQALMYSAS
jgi:valyl-tRNA synthetase